MRIVSCSFIFLMASTVLFVVSASASGIQFEHNSQTVELGPTGTATAISVSLAGTNQIQMPLDVEIIRDGKLTHAIVPAAEFNDRAKPTYRFTVASPKAGLVYRFRVRDESGKTWTSEYYFALKGCEEGTASEDLEAIASNPNAEVVRLAIQAADLEKQLLRSSLAEKRLLQLGEILQRSK